MKIDSIQNGIVLDHITAGKALQVYHDLELDKLDCSVAILQNVKSSKMGKKDILKIDKEYDVNLDVLGYIDPDITVIRSSYCVLFTLRYQKAKIKKKSKIKGLRVSLSVLR